MRTGNQPWEKEEQRAEGNEHQEHDVPEGIPELVTPLPEEPGRRQPTGNGFGETMIKAENCQPWETDEYFKEEREITCF